MYRSILYSLMAPSISPIHVMIWSSAVSFQLLNGMAIGGWLGGHSNGPRTRQDWDAHPWSLAQFVFGIAVFFFGLAGNYMHDDELREIRRAETRRQQRLEAAHGRKGVEKHYRIPEAGMFRYMLYPHYFLEWIEWAGFWIACGFGCLPAALFLVNEVTSMLPRALSGRAWYIERFGEEKIRKKWTIVPGVL